MQSESPDDKSFNKSLTVASPQSWQSINTRTTSVFSPKRSVKTSFNVLTKFTVGVLIYASLNACSSNQTEQSAKLAQNRTQTESLLKQIGTPIKSPKSNRTSLKILDSGIKPPNRNQLPAEFRQGNLVRYASSNPVSLTECLAKLSKLTNIHHQIQVGPEAETLNNNLKGANLDLAQYGLNQSIQADFNDSLAVILDQIANQFDLSWQYKNEQIVFQQYLTGRYSLAILPTQSAFANSIGNTNSTGSIDLPVEIKSAISMLAGDSSQVSFGDASGILTVVARPRAHQRIAEYVHQLNTFLNQQVALDVNVLSVSHNHDEHVSVGFDLLVGSPKDDWFRWSTRQPKQTGGNVNVGIVTGDVDLNLLITALNRQGEVSVETRTGATTSNNQVVPIQVVNQTAYAKSIQTVTSNNGGSGQTIEPGTLKTGFEMLLLPRILPSGEILLRYSIKLSDLNELAEFTSDNQTIQLPRLSTTSFEQQAILADNETLVLMGFERDRRSLEQPGKGILAAFSGVQNGTTTERISTVLTIQPRIGESEIRFNESK